MKTNIMGIFPGIENEKYHGMVDFLSSTGLREFAKSPAHYQAYLARKKKATASMFFGTNFHELIGEPMLFAKKYTKGLDKADYPNALYTATELAEACKKLGIKPGKNMAETTALLVAADPKIQIWIDLVAKHDAANVGKTVLPSEDYDALDGMLMSLLKNKTALALLTDGETEQSIFWTDPATGVKCKCRPDYLRNDGIIIDLKTTSKGADARSFQRSISDFKYHIQSEFYLQGVSHALKEPVSHFVHLVVETAPPYGVGIYTLDDVSLLKARAEIAVLLARFAECTAKNEWPGYEEKIENISIPAWML